MTRLYKYLTLSVGAVVMAGSLGASALATSSQPHYCDNFSITYCGATSPSNLISKIEKGDGRNTAANLQQVYYHEGWGITAAGISQTVAGVYYKDGHITVGGKTVATGGHSAGRIFETGSVKLGSVYLRPYAYGYNTPTQVVWVNMKSGQFQWAIMEGCGNMVKAKPVPKPSPSVTPTPTVTPTPSVSPTPTPIVPVTPTIPDTGAGAFSGLAGLGALGLTGRSYLKSKRSLLARLKLQ